MDAEEEKDLHFPKAGIDVSLGYGKQPNRPIGNGQYARTTARGVNVRTFEAATNRNRGGCRPGLTKWIDEALVEGWIIQELTTLVGSGYTPPGGTMQTSQSGRIVTLVAVSQGNVYTAVPGATSWTIATNATAESPPLNFTGIMFSAPNGQKLWFADGVNYCYFDPLDNTVQTWTPAAADNLGNVIVSVLPVDADGNTPRLIATWRGRTLLSGLIGDPQNVIMSAVQEPRNFDYSPKSTTPTQAVAFNASAFGLIGDNVTALVPYSDDQLVIGCDHHVWVMTGDPADGGRLDMVSDKIGFAFGQAWCTDPYGNIFFFSNRTGIYRMVPGSKPVRVSQPIEKLLDPIDTGTNSIRLLWDDRMQGFHVFITPLSARGSTTHYFYEARAGAWWQDQFANTNHNPLACCELDGNEPGDRVPLLGSWDGYVRKVDPDAGDDDGTKIDSEVAIGPITTASLDEVLLKDVQTVLAEDSADVTFGIHVGSTAEKALTSAAGESGTWYAGRNDTSYVRRAGHAIYIKLASRGRWAMESMRARIQNQGRVRRRGF